MTALGGHNYSQAPEGMSPASGARTNEALLSVTLAASIAAVEADHPGWQVWWVPVYTSGYLWCARRHSDPGAVLNAASAAQLRQRITDAGG